MNIREYMGSDTEMKQEFEEHIFENVFGEFARMLPTQKDIEKDTWNTIDVWSDGTEILCRTEEIADTIANILDAISGEPMSHTGYYDPDEDERSGEVDDHTGWYYVDYD